MSEDGIQASLALCAAAYHLLYPPSVSITNNLLLLVLAKVNRFLAFFFFFLIYRLGTWSFHQPLLCEWAQDSFWWGQLQLSYTLKITKHNSLYHIYLRQVQRQNHY